MNKHKRDKGLPSFEELNEILFQSSFKKEKVPYPYTSVKIEITALDGTVHTVEYEPTRLIVVNEILDAPPKDGWRQRVMGPGKMFLLRGIFKKD